jgi:hypothetical protein
LATLLPLHASRRVYLFGIILDRRRRRKKKPQTLGKRKSVNLYKLILVLEKADKGNSINIVFAKL